MIAWFILLVIHTILSIFIWVIIIPWGILLAHPPPPPTRIQPIVSHFPRWLQDISCYTFFYPYPHTPPPTLIQLIVNHFPRWLSDIQSFPITSDLPDMSCKHRSVRQNTHLHRTYNLVIFWSVFVFTR